MLKVGMFTSGYQRNLSVVTNSIAPPPLRVAHSTYYNLMLSIEYSKKKALSTKSEGNRRKSLKTTIFRFQKEEFLPIVHRLVVFKPFLTSAMPFLWQSRWGSSGLQSIVSTTFLYTFLSNPTVTFSIAASSQPKHNPQ